MAGVVNLVLKKNFEGFEGDASFSQPGHADGTIATIGTMMGASTADGRGNVTMYVSYQRREPTYQGDRAESSFSLNSPAFTSCSAASKALHYGFCPGGSSGIPAGRLSAGAGAGTMFTTSGTLVPYDGSLYNFAPINYLQTPNTHWDFGGNGHYEVNKHLDIYTRLTYSDNYAKSQLAEVPTNQLFKTNFGNPLLTAQERATLFTAANVTAGTVTQTGPGGTFAASDTASFNLRRRLVENGPRVSSEDHQMFQGVLGARGELGSAWTYDLSAQYGRTVWTHILSGDASGVKFQQALLAGGTAANPVCTDISGGCVPVNIFTGAGGITPAQASFFTVQLLGTGLTQQTDVQGSITGDLGQYGFKSPWATAGVGVSGGLEYRREQADFKADGCLSTPGCSAGFGSQPSIRGGYQTKEVFGEVQIPLIQNKPFFQQLEIDGGLRYSDYNLAGGATSFKAAVSWQPVDDVRVRGSFSRAIREANVSELFRPATNSAPAGTDPCAGGAGFTPSLALCLASGVKNNGDYLNGNGKGALDCGGQCSSYLKGNPNLSPEQGDTTSVGIVFTPSFIEGFTATVDYYNILVEKAIVALPFPTIVGNCFNPALNPSQSFAIPACGAIHRGPFGELYSTAGFVDQTNANIGKLITRGLDMQLSYGNDMALFGLNDSGSFRATVSGTAMFKSAFQSAPGNPEEVCTGQFGTVCGAPAAKWRHNARFTWISPDSDITLAATWRYIGGVHFDQTEFGRGGPGFSDPIEQHISDFHWFDLAGTWDVMPSVQIRGGISNIFDKKPPIVDGSNAGSPNVDSGNTFPGTYDAIGRTFFAGLNFKL